MPGHAPLDRGKGGCRLGGKRETKIASLKGFPGMAEVGASGDPFLRNNVGLTWFLFCGLGLGLATQLARINFEF